MIPTPIRNFVPAAAAVLLLLGLPRVAPGQDSLHDTFDKLLGAYVARDGVDYRAWSRNKSDLQKLGNYVDKLEATAVDELAEAAQLAFWINLYNAVTLELVLQHYPVDSIKDTADLMLSPWNKKLVRIDGEELSLNAIENEIIRPQFQDARIHFALNCAAIGCPPLSPTAYRGANLEAKLDEVTRATLNDPRWVRPQGDAWLVSKLFEWYGDDFVADAGSVAVFLARYRPEDLGDADSVRIRHRDYDWNLNEAGGDRATVRP